MEHLNTEWYKIRDIEKIDTPALVYYIDRIKHNIQLAISMVDNDPSRLRPHVKTHKTIEISRMLMDSGITKFKCATISEAEMLAMANAPDILLSYQPGGPKLERFAQLIKKYPSSQFSCLLDSCSNADEMSQIAARHHLVFNIYIDINVGMNRTGIAPGQKVLDLAAYVHNLPNLIIKGLHVYDGHIRMKDFEQRCSACNESFRAIDALMKNLKDLGENNLNIVAGGSPSFSVHAKRKNVECSPGTFVLWDHGYQETLKEQAFVPAALVISRAISQPADNLICLDLGHKSIASENPLSQRVVFLNATDSQFVSQSEEHLVIKTETPYTSGQIYYGVPYHVCPTSALYESAVIIKDNVVYDEWKIIARDRKITI